METPLFMQAVMEFSGGFVLLGSAVSLIIMLAYIPIIALRVKNEERALTRQLGGYSEYRQKACWKVLLFMW